MYSLALELVVLVVLFEVRPAYLICHVCKAKRLCILLMCMAGGRGGGAAERLQKSNLGQANLPEELA